MTKTERFKLNADRAAQRKKPKRKPHRVPKRVASTKQRLRAALVERSDRATARVPHNTALSVPRGSGYELESNGTGRPPRKSTRKSRLKPDNPLRIRATNRTASPEARSGRRRRRRAR